MTSRYIRKLRKRAIRQQRLEEREDSGGLYGDAAIRRDIKHRYGLSLLRLGGKGSRFYLFDKAGEMVLPYRCELVCVGQPIIAYMGFGTGVELLHSRRDILRLHDDNRDYLRAENYYVP